MRHSQHSYPFSNANLKIISCIQVLSRSKRYTIPQDIVPSVHSSTHSDEDLLQSPRFSHIHLAMLQHPTHRCTPMTVEVSLVNYETTRREPVVLLLTQESRQCTIFDTPPQLNRTPHALEQLGTVYATIADQHDNLFLLTLNVTNNSIVPTHPVYLSDSDLDTLRSRNISLESFTSQRRRKPDILIGIDYLWSFMTQEIPLSLPSGLVLCFTRFGPRRLHTDQQSTPFEFLHARFVEVTSGRNTSTLRRMLLNYLASALTVLAVNILWTSGCTLFVVNAFLAINICLVKIPSRSVHPFCYVYVAYFGYRLGFHIEYQRQAASGHRFFG
ncbi:hypothetical protein OSTOST_24479 [Ostertagia ostertagi]